MKNLLSVSVPPCLNKLRQNLPLLLVRGEGHPVPGIHFPSCDQDGYFLPEQCTVLDKQGNKKCWCVDRHGSKIEGTTECCKYSTLICELWMMQWFYEGQKKVYISREIWLLMLFVILIVENLKYKGARVAQSASVRPWCVTSRVWSVDLTSLFRLLSFQWSFKLALNTLKTEHWWKEGGKMSALSASLEITLYS